MTGEFFELMDLWRRQVAFAGGFAAMAPAAGFVVATRLAQMAGQPSEAGVREVERMVNEKMSALMEGGIAASRALTGLTMAVSPVAAGHIMVSAGEAALKPAARKLRANAKRLSR